MNIEQVESLARIMKQYSLTKLEMEDEGTCIKLEAAPAQAAPQTVQQSAMSPAPQEPVPAAIQPPGGEGVDFNALNEVKSPMVGVFYAAASPDADDFVTVGSQVKKGDVLCIIEAMKLMNEITADMDGEVVDICVGNGQVVEYGQALFKIF